MPCSEVSIFIVSSVHHIEHFLPHNTSNVNTIPKPTNRINQSSQSTCSFSDTCKQHACCLRYPWPSWQGQSPRRSMSLVVRTAWSRSHHRIRCPRMLLQTSKGPSKKPISSPHQLYRCHPLRQARSSSNQAPLSSTTTITRPQIPLRRLALHQHPHTHQLLKKLQLPHSRSQMD